MRNSRFERKFLAVFLLYVIDFNNILYAMKVQPMHLEMQSLGSGSIATVNVDNEGSNNLPVELSIERLTLDIDGNPSYQPAEDDWLIFPPQVIIPPHGQQNFRLQWLGEPDLEASDSFHLAIKQVPVEMPEGQSSIQLVYNIRALVNVAPPNIKADLTVVEVVSNVDDGTNSQQSISLLLENPSKKHALFSRYNLMLSMLDPSGKELWSKSIPGNDIFQLIGAGMVQPGSQRKFNIPIRLPTDEHDSNNLLKATVTESGF